MRSGVTLKQQKNAGYYRGLNGNMRDQPLAKEDL
jgi:hypothetical protein